MFKILNMNRAFDAQTNVIFIRVEGLIGGLKKVSYFNHVNKVLRFGGF